MKCFSVWFESKRAKDSSRDSGLNLKKLPFIKLITNNSTFTFFMFCIHSSSSSYIKFEAHWDQIVVGFQNFQRFEKNCNFYKRPLWKVYKACIYVKKFKEFLSNYLLSGGLGGRTDVCISSLLGLVSTVYCTLASEIVIASISTP